MALIKGCEILINRIVEFWVNAEEKKTNLKKDAKGTRKKLYGCDAGSKQTK